MSGYSAPVTRSRSVRRHGQSSSPEASAQALSPEAEENDTVDHGTGQPVLPSPPLAQNQTSAPVTVEAAPPGELGTGSLGSLDESPEPSGPRGREYYGIKRKGSLNLDEERPTKAASPEVQSGSMPLVEDISWELANEFNKTAELRDTPYLVGKILSVVDSEDNSKTKFRKLAKIVDFALSGPSSLHGITHEEDTHIPRKVLDWNVGFVGAAVVLLAETCEAAASPEEANSAKYDMVKHVTADFARYLTHPLLCYPLFEAAIWDTVVAELFETESAIWAGEVGRSLNRIIKQVEGQYIQTTFLPYPRTAPKWH